MNTDKFHVISFHYSIDTIYRLLYSILVQWRSYLMVKGVPIFNITEIEMVSSSLFNFYTYFLKKYSSTSFSFELSSSLSLSTLTLRERADTIITFHHHTTTTPPPHHHHQLLFIGDLYSSVMHHWNRQFKPYFFPLRKYRVN